MEHYICVEINEKVKEGANQLEAAVFERYDFVDVLGELQIKSVSNCGKVQLGRLCRLFAQHRQTTYVL